ncbi:hypothetical protein ACFPL7_10240 [Dongia soli]|uniref:Uncharacterized protein n=1 Tax=Dongia soli TaxID=600628 RepID=A0ABU5EAW7_9PROT|nr:hypothetical protein [Dongia soli]MDY0883328.1 hypothetical protein [Dongia soli]
MNDRDVLDCLIFGLSRGFVSARRPPRPSLDEQFPQPIEPESAPVKTRGILSRLRQCGRHRQWNTRLSPHRRLQHCG